MKNTEKTIASSNVESLMHTKSYRLEKRKRYMPVQTWLSFCLSISLIIMAFEWKTFDNGSMVELTSLTNPFEDLLDIPVTQQPPPPPPAVQQPIVLEVPDEVEIEEDIKIDLDINMNEEDIIVDIVTISEPEEEKAETIFQIVEEMPSPKGGLQTFYKYLNKNLKYPSKAQRIGIEGRVHLSFVVETDGSLTDIKVMRGIGAGCDEESIRVMQHAPKWNPGKQRGNPVRVRYAFPIVFKLN